MIIFERKKNRQVGLEIAERDLQIEIRKGIIFPANNVHGGAFQRIEIKREAYMSPRSFTKQ